MKTKLISRALCVLLAMLMLLAMIPATAMAAEGTTARPYRELTADEIVAEMGTGWNLGNTMDGHTGFTPNETLWQNVKTTQTIIDAVHDAGFNTVRIPTTWGNYINEDFTIEEKWISRVQDIVDYCVRNDMYVIINIHHDGAEQSGWLRIASDDFESVKTKFAGAWNSIAERFKDYDEHVIFESMNEVVGDDNSNDGIKRDVSRIMELNQIFVDTVRATGSNNAIRWLSVPSRYTNIAVTTNDEYGFALPKDTVENRIFVAVHYYDWNFGMLENLNTTEFAPSSVAKLAYDFDLLEEKFTSKGVPVILGEYGAINKNNPVARAYHLEAVNRLCQQAGVVPVYWDQGWYDRTMDPDFSYTLFDRETGESIDKVVTDAITRGYFHTGADDAADIVNDPTVTAITEITMPESLALNYGDVKTVEATVAPAENNDVLLWSTSDPTVATVYNGKIIARGIGAAVITAKAQSGETSKEMVVVVSNSNAEEGVTVTTSGAVEVAVDANTYIEASASNGEDLIYKSTDPSVASVSAQGRVVGIATGETKVIVTSISGATAVVPVKVIAAASLGQLNASINVYYNDTEKSYFNNEVGECITITDNGQYTLTFDCDQHLSDAAKNAGVNSLTNLTAIYIKDQDVTNGTAAKTAMSACNIMWDKVVVDGKELTVTMTEPKSALKDSGVFDTNDPINSWDGSQVAEIDLDATNHVANFKGIKNPKTISITFTISDIAWATAELPMDEKPVTAAAIEGSDTVELGGDVASAQLQVAITPAKTTDKITFTSSNPAVAYVDSTAVSVDTKTGLATMTVYAISEGSVEISARADSGRTVKWTVNVGEVAAPADDVSASDATGIALSTNAWITIGFVAFLLVVVAVVVIVLVRINKGGKKEEK